MTTPARTVTDAEALPVRANTKAKSSDIFTKTDMVPEERKEVDQFRTVDRVMETRHERNTELVQESRSNDREDIIDLTTGDVSLCGKAVDLDSSDRRVGLNKMKYSEISHFVTVENVERQKEPRLTELNPASESRGNHVFEKTGPVSVEAGSAKVKEKIDEGKESIKKSKPFDKEGRRKNSLNPTHASKAVKNSSRSRTTSQKSSPEQAIITDEQDVSVNVESRGIEILNTNESSSRSAGANQLLSESCEKKTSLTTPTFIVGAKNVDNTESSNAGPTTRVDYSIDEKGESDMAMDEGDYSSDCAWYFCGGGNRDSILAPRGNRLEKTKNSGTPGSPTAQPDKIGMLEDIFLKEASPDDDIGFWSAIKFWIDPAPTSMMETLNDAALAKNLEELGITTGSTDASVLNSGHAKLGSVIADCQASIRQPRLISAMDASEASCKDSESITDEENPGNHHFSLERSTVHVLSTGAENATKKAHSHQISAFEQVVKPACISPAGSLEQSSSKDDGSSLTRAEAEDSSLDPSTQNLLGDDLKSLPSVKEDVTAGVSALQPDDPEIRLLRDMASSSGEKVTKLKSNEAKRELLSNSTLTVDDSFEARRQSLVKELRSTIAMHGRYDIRCAALSSALGDILDEAGDHAHAVRLHKDAVAIYSCKLGDDHTTTMAAKMRLGAVLENAQQFDEAIGLYYLVTVMRRALNGEADPSVADGQVRMAQALRKKSDFLQAIKELKRALKIYRESLGDAHEKVASTVDQIASLYVTVGDFDKSASILEEVVKLKAATIGMSSRAVAQTLSTLATTYECSEKFSNAMKALKKAYKIYTELGGYSSEDSTATLNRIAQLYEAMGDQNRASIAYLGVLRARKILRGSDSLAVGEIYFRLGHSLRETGQFDKALKCLKEALPIFVGQGVEMNDMKMVADIMHEMAFINQDRGNYQDAVRIFKQELSVRRKIGQPEFPLVARTLNHLGVAEFELRNNSRSLKYLVEALTIFQEKGEQGVECAEVLFNTGLVFDAAQNKQRALEAYVEAARIFREHGYKEDHPHLQKAIEKIEKAQRSLEP